MGQHDIPGLAHQRLVVLFGPRALRRQCQRNAQRDGGHHARAAAPKPPAKGQRGEDVGQQKTQRDGQEPTLQR